MSVEFQLEDLNVTNPNNIELTAKDETPRDPANAEKAPKVAVSQEELHRIYSKMKHSQLVRSNIRDLVLFTLFFLLFLVIVFLIKDIKNSYQMESALKSTFLDQEFSPYLVKKTFWDISQPVS